MKKDTVIGIAGLIISALYGFGITRLSNPSEIFFAGTTVFPILITIGAIIFSLLLIARGQLAGENAPVLEMDSKVLKMMAIFTAVFAVYIVIFNKIGFLISTIAMLTSILFIFNVGKSQRVVNLIIGIVFPVLCYVIFAKIFSISLPRGILPF
ncbi:Tripartite tricarboxylate transporter TctB family protein [Dethiosulfatibacter aminovorans DSM 17477]|uniref:Tripartite tricarboxylate transporter TctB family protein n=1 Tax=Dethiosulfatibacter aminovorans DSM 17477 TaxID=1121476 RepID=A0A1M6GNU2_9FIRM|nr:tripartite tricarboxylate transporter TctB family protein [Dethiosulfatibacter aminovorans]SHJ11651.1 Tripartite tricarboxylate transporter TctB family protein [Dethiosulfatibacter aminovorans DSM 17477]